MQIGDLVYLGNRLAKSGQLAMHEVTPGLQTAESLVMAELFEQRFSTVTEIAQRTGYAQSRISTAVASLREQGWVSTRPDTADRRRTVVFASKRASDAARQMEPRSADGVLDALLATVPRAQRKVIAQSLEDLLDVLRQPEQPAVARPVDGETGATLDRWAGQLGITRAQLDKMTPTELAQASARREGERPTRPSTPPEGGAGT